jgi:uncharacterized protein
MIIGTVEQIWRYPVKSMGGQRLTETSVSEIGIPGDRGWAVRDETTKEITTGTRTPLAMQCNSAYDGEPIADHIPHVEISLPDGSTVRSDDPDVNQRLSEVFGKPVTLWPKQPATDKDHYRRRSAAARILGPLAQYPAVRSLLPAITKVTPLGAMLREEFSREPGEPVPDLSTLPPEIFQFTSPLGTYFDAFPIHVLSTASLETMKKLNSASDWDVRRFRPNFLIRTNADLAGLPDADWTGRGLRIGTVEIKCEIPCVRCGMTTQKQKDVPKDPSVLRTIVKEADQNLGSYANVTKAGTVKEGDRVELI